MLDKYEANSLVRFWLGPALFIFVNDPKLIEQVLDSPKCLEKSFLYKFLRLDKGLLAAKRKCDLGGTFMNYVGCELFFNMKIFNEKAYCVLNFLPFFATTQPRHNSCPNEPNILTTLYPT